MSDQHSLNPSLRPVDGTALAALLGTAIRAPSLIFGADGLLVSAHPEVDPAVVALWRAAARETVWPARSMAAGEIMHALQPGAAQIRRLSGAGGDFILVTPQLPPGHSQVIRRQVHDLRVALQALNMSLSQPGEASIAIAARVQGHIEDILSPNPGEITVFDISADLRDLAALLEPVLAATGAQLELDLPRGLMVEGRRIALRRLVQNLLQNAARESQGGVVGLRLRCRQTRDTGLLAEISVTDAGSGLPAAAARQLDGNVQAEMRADGHGQGMGIIAAMARELGGRVSSRPGPPHRMVVRFRLKLAYGRPRKTAALISGARILLVEDDATVSDLVGGVLRSHGARVTAVATISAALAATGDDGMPDLLICDYLLGDATGAQLIRTLRGYGFDRPLVVLTGDDSSEVRNDCMAAGADHVLLKPLSPATLVEEITHQLLLGRTRQPGNAAPTLNPVAHVNTQPEDDMGIDPEIFAELRNELGLEVAAVFMLRALGEAKEIALPQGPASYDALRQPVHSALGACAMTGLTHVAEALRGLQLVLKSRLAPEASLNALNDTIVRTESRIIQLRDQSGPAIETWN